MFYFFFLSAIIKFSCHLLANGQCTVSDCKDFASGLTNCESKDQGDYDQKLQIIHQNLISRIERIEEKFESFSQQLRGVDVPTKCTTYCLHNPVVCDCTEIKSNCPSNGVYRIYVEHQKRRYYAHAYCAMTTGNRSWTVFQRRQDGSQDFYRGWSDYADGFGDSNGEYWLGNNILHLLTSKRNYRLRIDLEDFEGEKAFAEYSTFNISSSTDKYRLSFGQYSGNAGDSLQHHNRQQFTTKDADNDVAQVNCAVHNHGAWWYHACEESNLNGIYYRRNPPSIDLEGVTWGSWRGYSYSLKSVEMKISPIV